MTYYLEGALGLLGQIRPENGYMLFHAVRFQSILHAYPVMRLTTEDRPILADVVKWEMQRPTTGEFSEMPGSVDAVFDPTKLDTGYGYVLVMRSGGKIIHPEFEHAEDALKLLAETKPEGGYLFLYGVRLPWAALGTVSVQVRIEDLPILGEAVKWVMQLEGKQRDGAKD